MHKTILLLLLFLTSGCSTSDTYNEILWTEIEGRDNGISLERKPTYRAKVPKEWVKKNAESNESIFDTRKSLCEFHLPENVHITIHNFPSNQLNDRISPQAQIARWKRQFDQWDPTSFSIEPQSFGGFVGFVFEGSGMINGESITMMGWTMQLGVEHYRHLNCSQMRGDFTIKAVGPNESMQEQRQAIVAFARTFGLIEEIPSSS